MNDDDPIYVKVDPMLAELAQRFLSRCKNTATEFRQALESRDWIVARRIGHSLFGTASSFGFDELAAIGKEIEEAARLEDANALERLAERLEAHIPRLRTVSA